MKQITGFKAFLILGILMALFVGGFIVSLYQYNDRKDNYKETVAVISYVNDYEEWDSERDNYVTYYQVFVDYEVDGEKYEHVLYEDEAQFRPRVGEEVNILYNPENPEVIMNRTVSAITPILASLPMVVMAGFIIFAIIKHKKDSK